MFIGVTGSLSMVQHTEWGLILKASSLHPATVPTRFKDQVFPVFSLLDGGVYF